MELLNLSFAGIGAVFGAGLGWMWCSARMAKLSGQLSALREQAEKATEFHERAITAETENRNLQAQLTQQQEQLRAEFKNTASTIFDDFSLKSEKKIGDLLNPLRERLGEFQKKIDDSFTAHGKEQHSLKTEIEKIVLQTDGLTKALRGDVKAQGNWGEVMLERILEESGLKRGEDYIVQAAGMGLSNADGGRMQPDVIVNLPDNKHIIIDSKVSLTSYERYCSEKEEAIRAAHLRDFLKSVKSHINGLEAKRYQDLEKLTAPDFVMLFMPIEGAYSLAVQSDAELHAYAWGKKIVLVCPATLFASLRTIASLWRIERQNRNTQEIARQGGLLYDKFVVFFENMQDIGDKISGLQKSYDNAAARLSTGSGNLVARVQKLKQLGATASKSLPKELEAMATAQDAEEV